ncbi:thermonuclease family protein [Mesorhizobium huakuii]|uniref:Thermonuclease family protein n=1 Tax=Mesorhizobium huakuii TaxID=28104 RepID=A0ABZ0VUE0_9HYPH|nr:thermonuclease family protein [Mesorhizobium huakuii]WQC01118.1 thermonuclease family protein [Mesorhizobium huakuii]
MGKGQLNIGADQADRWRKRKRTGRRSNAPMRLVFVTVAAAAAFATQHVITHGALLPSPISTWLEPLPPPMVGRASVIDGDTIEIASQRIRFNGIDAPESRQYCDDAKGFEYPCGQQAAKALDEFLTASRPLYCKFVDRDQHGRLVGDCYRADRQNVQSWLVEQGLALDWPRYSNGAFATEQASAKAAHRGVWQGRFDQPWYWRAANADKVETASQQSTGFFGLLGSGCNIKGNISINTGEHIYHIPGQEHYSETKISPQYGERWFCSEEEALAAGWRKARR